jgi:uncharacterized lipoprotein YajG
MTILKPLATLLALLLLVGCNKNEPANDTTPPAGTNAPALTNAPPAH